MNRYVLTAAVAALVLAAAGGICVLALFLRPSEPGWTTRSGAAAKELEEGLSDLQLYSWNDAALHFERALELDPEFAAARLYLSYVQPGDRRLLAELREVDQKPLTARERYLVRLWLAYQDEGGEAARAVLDHFLDEYPDDFFALEANCGFAWEEQDLAAAEKCYRRMLELHPNWAQGHNRLGLLSMAQGKFSAAEEHFHTYRFIAPGQAASHASIAQLLTVLGRYEEAEEALSRSLELKPDYCFAHVRRIRLYLFAGRHPEAREAIARIEGIERCSGGKERGNVCALRIGAAYLEGDLEEAATLLEDCLPEIDYDVVSHRAAVATRRLAVAEELEARLVGYLEEHGERVQPIERDWIQAAQAHARGVRRLAAGDYGGGVGDLAEADGKLRYWGARRPSFKLLNRRTLVYALRLAGQTTKAEVMTKKIAAVNPRFGALPLPDMELLLKPAVDPRGGDGAAGEGN